MKTITTWYKNHSRLVKIFQILIILLAVALLIQNLVSNWQTLVLYDWDSNLILSLPALLFLALGLFLLPAASQFALNGLGYRVTYLDIFQKYFIAQLSKYLPGGIWMVPGRAVVYQQLGVNVLSSSLGFVMELFVLIFTGTLVFLPYLVYTQPLQMDSLVWIAIAIVLAAFFVLAATGTANHLLAWVLQKLGYPVSNINLSFRQLFSIFLLDIIYWILVGTGFFLLASSIYDLPAGNLLPFISAFSLSWIIGFFTFLTPSGIGVREGALAIFLAPFLPEPFPVIIALAARVWWTLGDLVTIGLAALLQHRQIQHRV